MKTKKNKRPKKVQSSVATHDPSLPTSGTYTPAVIEDIQVKAELGRYRIRGFGTLRPRTWSTFDDLTFLPCGLTRIPLEGYRESCSTKTVLGTRFAEKPIELDIPVMITGMSFGALSHNAKVALAVGGTLPLLPLALKGTRAVPLDLEATYTDARQRGRL